MGEKKNKQYDGPIYDYHLHSSFSYDCAADVGEICRQAIAYGAAGLMFTEHIEIDDIDGYDYLIDFSSYSQAIDAARAKYPGLILGCGMELGLQPHLYEQAKVEIDRYPWDFVLGSTHIIDAKAVFNGDFSAGRSRDVVYREFLERTYQAVKNGPRFDVLGHLDLIRRDNAYQDRSLCWRDFPDELDAILRTVISRGIGIEINTAAVLYQAGGFHPDPSVLKRYRELGGEIITCGSDSHQAFRVCNGLREAYQQLIDCGFRYISTFSKRQLKQLPLA